MFIFWCCFRSDITAILLSTLSFLWSCCKSVAFLLDPRWSVAPFPAIHRLCSCLLTTLVRTIFYALRVNIIVKNKTRHNNNRFMVWPRHIYQNCSLSISHLAVYALKSPIYSKSSNIEQNCMEKEPLQLQLLHYGINCLMRSRTLNL